MFYKFFENGRKKAIDLDDVYLGQPCFIIAGSPTLKDENLELLNQRGILTLAMNNAAEVFKPNFWVGGDRPECYSKRILLDTSILKFANYGKRHFMFEGKYWKLQPATLFYGMTTNVTRQSFLHRRRDIVWWHNTWWIMMQLVWKLGFRTLYLLGAEFKMEENNQYAWETKLRKKEIQSNKRLYNKTSKAMGEMKPMFDAFGLKIINCCKTSSLVPAYGYVSLEKAVEAVNKIIPQDGNTIELPHSMRKKV